MSNQHSQISVIKRYGSHEAIIPSNDDSRICWKPEKKSFYLKFKCKSDNRWYYQWLLWSCRAGKKSYYRQVIALYRELRKQGLVKPNTLRSLAS